MSKWLFDDTQPTSQKKNRADGYLKYQYLVDKRYWQVLMAPDVRSTKRLTQDYPGLAHRYFKTPIFGEISDNTCISVKRKKKLWENLFEWVSTLKFFSRACIFLHDFNALSVYHLSTTIYFCRCRKRKNMQIVFERRPLGLFHICYFLISSYLRSYWLRFGCVIGE